MTTFVRLFNHIVAEDVCLLKCRFWRADIVYPFTCKRTFRDSFGMDYSIIISEFTHSSKFIHRFIISPPSLKDTHNLSPGPASEPYHFRFHHCYSFYKHKQNTKKKNHNAPSNPRLIDCPGSSFCQCSNHSWCSGVCCTLRNPINLFLIFPLPFLHQEAMLTRGVVQSARSSLGRNRDNRLQKHRHIMHL